MAHRNVAKEFFHRLWRLAANINPEFVHHLHGQWMNSLARVSTRIADVHDTASVLSQSPFRHMTASDVFGAQAEHNRFHHDDSNLLVWEGWTGNECYDIFKTMKIRQAVTALSALAQESRLQVFRLLVEMGPDGLAAGDIAARLKIPAATLSFHLKELAHAGLIKSRKEGRFVIYAHDVKGINCLMGFLIADCCQGRPELCASECRDDSARSKKKPARKVRST